jgi:hypothetical protein
MSRPLNVALSHNQPAAQVTGMKKHIEIRSRGGWLIFLLLYLNTGMNI